MTEPRKTPLIDDRYMALAWIYAGFSKDPNTQVGAQIIGENNYPLGAGYNGPPRKMDDNKIPWHRPSADNPEEYCKYDVTTHAERNAIRHTNRLGSGKSLIGSTLYITALPCPPCMLFLVEEEIKRVIYCDFQSDSDSSLQNQAWKKKSFNIAKDGGIELIKYEGNISWLQEWIKIIEQKNPYIF